MIPSYSDDWASVYVGDSLELLRQMPERSVHCCVTSPPFWHLRSYLPSDHPDKAMELGAEPTPELYVERLVEVFRALRRVLREEGQLWLNLGSSYAGSWGNQGRKEERGSQRPINGPMIQNLEPYPQTTTRTGSWANDHPQFKAKDLVPIPWMVAMALQRDGWYLRSDIIWQKPNPMPSSVTDRPTCSHEYVFLLTKAPRYFFDQEAVREPHTAEGLARAQRGVSEHHKRTNGAPGQTRHTLDTTKDQACHPSGRNIRSVWSIPTKPYPGQHYATMPVDLVYPCIRAGTSEYGACEACGAPWERVVEHKSPPYYQGGKAADLRATGAANHRTASGPTGNGLNVQGSRTIGWQPTCSCNGEYIKEPYEVSVVNRETGEPETFTRYRSVYVPGIPLSEHPIIPATVLDPFMGSGTTALAARKLGRRSIGFDLDERNVKQIEERLGWQGVMF